MPRSFLIKKKSDRENPAECSQPEPNCDDKDGGKEMMIDQQTCPALRDHAALRDSKPEPEVDDATLLVPARRTTIWSPAAELHVEKNKKSTANVSPTSGLTPFTPLSAAAAAAAAFLHPKGNKLRNVFTCIPSLYK